MNINIEEAINLFQFAEFPCKKNGTGNNSDEKNLCSLFECPLFIVFRYSVEDGQRISQEVKLCTWIMKAIDKFKKRDNPDRMEIKA